MTRERPKASPEEVSTAIREIRAYHEQGRQSLRDLRQRGGYGVRAIDEQAERLGWTPTKMRKARQFAHRQQGYTRERLNELCRLLREHRPVFGVSHVGLLVTVDWPAREQLQRECIEGNWSKSELQAEVTRCYGLRRQGGRKKRVPSDPAQTLAQLDQEAKKWERWYAVASELNDEKETILNALPETVRERVQEVKRAVTRLRTAIADELKAGGK